MNADATPDLSFSSLQLPYRWGEARMTTPEPTFVLPSGTVTFLLTDIEGSTRMWGEETPEDMTGVVLRHLEILGDAVAGHGGVRPQEQGEGDSIVAAFARPSDAVAAALAAQLALHAEPWATSRPPLVRMALHTGEAQLRDDANYAGQAIIRTARLRSIGHGGQILVSGATRDLAVDQGGDTTFTSLGEHRLRDLGRPESVWQLVHPDLPTDFPPLLSLEGAPHNLPASLSPFIGRLDEISKLAQLVGAERLVTATGSGGAGKTRLAQQVGAELLHQFAAGVWWAELAPVGDDDVEATFRAALGISEASANSIEDATVALLDGRSALLIVDNCEHVAVTAADLVGRLLRAAPDLHVLATSRVMLDLPGECAWRVPALAMPDRHVPTPIEALAQYDAVELFCDRARRARPNFRLSDDNGPTIAEMCHRLGGIPLALELAAARCRMLTPAEILDGLSDALRVLGRGSRADLPRQQTLEASIAWSVELLDDSERLLLSRISVFVDGWTLDAAEAVATDDRLPVNSVFDALDRLVDHSLVQVEDTHGGSRFRMLETVTQFARRLVAVDLDDQRAVRDRHARFFQSELVLFDAGGGPTTLTALGDRLVPDEENIRAAFDHLLTIDDTAAASAMLLPYLGLFERHLSMMRMCTALIDRPDVAGTRAEWLALLVRGAVQVDASNLGGVFVDLGGAIDAARALGNEADERFSTAVLDLCLTIGGDEQIDRMLDSRNWFERHGDHRRASFLDSLLAFAGSYQRIDVARAAIARFDGTADQWAEPRQTGIVQLARVTVQAHDCEPIDVERALRDVANRRLMPQVRVGITSTTNADAVSRGRRAPIDVAVLLDAQRIDGSPWARFAPFNFVALEALQDDRLEDAKAGWDVLKQRAEAQLLLPSFWTQTGLALIEAGIADPPDLPDPSQQTVPASRLRLANAVGCLVAGRPDEAEQILGQILPGTALQAGRRFVLAVLEATALARAANGRSVDAARFIGCCERFREEVGLVRLPAAERAWVAARALIEGTEGGDEAITEGRSITLERGLELAARSHSPMSRATVGWAALTPTERQVAELAADGRTNPQIGRELLMSPETVKTHLSRVFTKLGIAGRRELPLAFAQRLAEPI